MRFVIEMDDDQYRRLERNLEKLGATLTEAISDFFDDLDDANVAEERLSEIASGKEQVRYCDDKMKGICPRFPPQKLTYKRKRHGKSGKDSALFFC
jgi:predicted DNA-binding protein